MGASNWVHVEDCHIEKTSEKAVLIRAEGVGEQAFWVPRSQIADSGENLEEGDGPITVSITEWIAKQKGIEVES